MANTYPNLTKAFIRSSIGVAIFLIIVVMGAGCMVTTIGSGACSWFITLPVSLHPLRDFRGALFCILLLLACLMSSPS